MSNNVGDKLIIFIGCASFILLFGLFMNFLISCSYDGNHDFYIDFKYDCRVYCEDNYYNDFEISVPVVKTDSVMPDYFDNNVGYDYDYNNESGYECFCIGKLEKVSKEVILE